MDFQSIISSFHRPFNRRVNQLYFFQQDSNPRQSKTDQPTGATIIAKGSRLHKPDQEPPGLHQFFHQTICFSFRSDARYTAIPAIFRSRNQCRQLGDRLYQHRSNCRTADWLCLVDTPKPHTPDLEFVLLVTTFGLSLYPALVSQTDNITLIIIMAGFAGIFQAGIDLVFFDELMKTVPVEYSATFISIAQSLQYTSSVLSPLIGTFLATTIGLSGALMVSAGIRFCGFLLFAFWTPREKSFVGRIIHL